MHTYAQTIEQWQGAYVLIGELSATLSGLLFVAVSFNLRTIMHKGNGGLRTNAVQTFNQFVLLLEISIVFQIPGTTETILGLSLCGLAIIACLINLFAFRDKSATGIDRRRQLPASLLFIGVALIGLAIASGNPEWLYLLIGLVIAILITSVFSAWGLLVEVGVDEMTQGTEPDR